jgi:hypothetical protein
MLMQDQFSGYVHEVPAPQYPLGEVVYDGLGNPVGFSPFNLIKRVVSAPFNLVRGAVRGIGNLFRGGARPPFPVPPMSAPGGMPMYPRPPYRPIGFGRSPWPLGWNRSSLPYTGLGPRRLYMRCAVWPGPAGLVPANVPPGAAQIPGFPGAAGPAAGRRRRRRRR